jgi:hypothetical protein
VPDAQISSRTEALESGQWRAALRVLGAGRDAYLAANLRTVARAMAFRAAGEHGRARETLGVAAAGIARRPPGWRRRRSTADRRTGRSA